MWLLSILLGVIPLVVSSTPIDSLLNPHRASDAGPILVTGLSTWTSDGSVPLRREIHDLKDNFPDQWNLYMLGLRSLQLTDETSPVSWYEIAGIHGRPFKTWQGVEGLPNTVGPYCPHQNTMFLGWHRPYLALFEQELYQHVQSIAQQFPPSLIEKYTSAAVDFRIPYWDWALGMKGPTLPEYFVSPQIQVIGLNGAAQTIPNPLYCYDFHPLIQGDFTDQYALYNTTLRWPTSLLANAESQNGIVTRDFNDRRRNILTKISQAFTIPMTMNEVSRNYIEDVHGWIHYSIGGNAIPGHMWPPEYSAFDPVFMLHHAQVDRLFALWSAAHPDKYIEPAEATTGNLWIAQGSIVDGDTQLLPFRNTPTSFWTTNGIMDTRIFGYAYPETQVWNYASDAEYRAAVNASISQLYSSSARAMLTASPDDLATTSLNFLLDADMTFVDWNVRVQGSHTDLPSTFIVKFFLVGDFSSDPVKEVGAWTVLSSSHHQAGAEKKKRMDALEQNLKGMVGLTESLLDDISVGKLGSLDKKNVVPYLTQRLSWKVIAANGGLVPQDNLGSLTVEVVSTRVRIPDDPNELLVYSGEWEGHPEITVGKSGGVRT